LGWPSCCFMLHDPLTYIYSSTRRGFPFSSRLFLGFVWTREFAFLRVAATLLLLGSNRGKISFQRLAKKMGRLTVHRQEKIIIDFMNQLASDCDPAFGS
jgi:hypothetical protein